MESRQLYGQEQKRQAFVASKKIGAFIGSVYIFGINCSLYGFLHNLRKPKVGGIKHPEVKEWEQNGLLDKRATEGKKI